MAKAKVLITIEVTGKSDDDNAMFFSELESKSWVRVDNLTTAWAKSVEYENSGNKQSQEFQRIKRMCVEEMSMAKTIAEIESINYAIHIGSFPIYKQTI